MAIDPTTTTTVKVSELASAGFNTSDLVPHEVGGYLKKGTLQDLATFIGEIISTDASVGFRAVHITDGQTLPATTEEEFILVGPGTYPNVGGGSAVTTTEALNALVSNGTYWFIGVEIPISASGTWGSITGVLSDQTDLYEVLEAKADLVDGKVPSSQLPSYVDDVVEVANYAALPVSGETGKIYITIDTGNVYRWSGSAYIRIADDDATWGLITGTLSSQTDLQSALDAKFNNPTGNTTQYIAGDGSLITFPTAGQAGTLVREVRNTTGATLTKGTIVYISGAAGNKPTITKAIATGDSTSAQTFGMLQADISNNANGYVVCVGDLTGLNTSAIAEGSQLYLSSTTAGAYTTTKQLAPAHLVYIGIVTRSHATLGQIEVKIQNGYELEELHDVAISSKSDKDILTYESSTDLWKNKNLGTIIGGSGSQFLKGNGVLDSTVYAIDSFVVHLTGDETITGKKTFNNSGSSISIDINNSSTGKGLNSLNSSSGFGIYSNNSSTGNGIHSVNSSTGKGIFSSNTSSSVGIYSDNSSTGAGLFSVNSSTGNGIHATNSSTGKGIYALNSSTGFGMYAENQSTGKGIYSLNSSTGYGIHSENASTGRGIYSDNKLGGFGIFSLNSSTGTGIYSDNTSSGKGIHSINSANGTGIYAENTSGGNGIYLNNTAAGTGVLIDNTGSVGLRLNNLSTTNGIYLDNSSTGNGIYSANSSTGNGFRSVNSSTGKGISSSNQSGGSGIYSFNSGSGSGIYAENSSSFGKAFYLNNTGIVGFEVYHNSGGTGILLENNGFKGLVVNNYLSGKAVIINNTTVGSGTPFSVQKNEVDKFTISDAGGVFAAGSVGIGTTSPSEKLQVNGNILAVGNIYTTDSNILNLGYNQGGGATLKYNSNGNLDITPRAGYNTIFTTGNVGIGTTSPANALSVFTSSSTGTIASFTRDLSTDATLNIGADNDGTYLETAGIHNLRVLTNASERMRITSGGNVGIGTTSPAQKLDVSGIIRASSDFEQTGNSVFKNTSYDMYLQTDAAGAGIIFRTSGATERMRITSGGNVGIGTSSPFSQGSGATTMELAGNTYGQFFVSANSAAVRGVVMARASTLNDVYIASITNSPLIFGTNDAERMRVTSGGFVGIGTTSVGRPLVVDSVNGGTVRFHNGNNVNGNVTLSMELGGSNTDNTSSYYLYCDTDNVGVKMVIYGNGNLANVNNSYGAYSDIKLKENIIDTTPKLQDLLKVKIRNYNLIGDDKKQIGVIAQELEEVFPGLIEESDDLIKDDLTGENIANGETTKSVKYSVFVPIIVKAMQELAEQVNELKAEIEILKNK